MLMWWWWWCTLPPWRSTHNSLFTPSTPRPSLPVTGSSLRHLSNHLYLTCSAEFLHFTFQQHKNLPCILHITEFFVYPIFAVEKGWNFHVKASSADIGALCAREIYFSGSLAVLVLNIFRCTRQSALLCENFTFSWASFEPLKVAKVWRWVEVCVIKVCSIPRHPPKRKCEGNEHIVDAWHNTWVRLSEQIERGEKNSRWIAPADESSSLIRAVVKFT